MHIEAVKKQRFQKSQYFAGSGRRLVSRKPPKSVAFSRALFDFGVDFCTSHFLQQKTI